MIDLSADMGEGTPGEDAIWPLINSANVACGGHTGDVASMREAARRARDHGVRFGAHPSYPDPENFGRKSLDITRSELLASLAEQLESIRAIARREDVDLRHVKPHGALYNDAHRDEGLAESIVEAIREVDPALALVCSHSSAMARVARAAGTPVIREAFADRRYAPDGSLVPRGEPRALLNVVEAAEQAALLASDGVIVALDGSRVTIPFDTICIHADMGHAVERLHAIRARLAV